jgi:hypothetical protein
LAGEAFKNARVLKVAREFVPVLIDGDVDKEFGTKWSASGYPHVIFASAKGKELGRVRGYVPTDRFLTAIQDALKKNGKIRLTRAAKALEKADTDLAKARTKGDWRGVLRAVLAIEKIGHEGPALKRATEARKEAEEEAARRVETARALIEKGELETAKKLLRALRTEMAALKDIGKEAKALLGEIAAAEKDG